MVHTRLSLEEEYDRLCHTPSDIYEHLPRFVQLCRQLQAQHVIELGTRSGVSTIAWLYGLKVTGGRLTSVDIDAKPDLGDWPHWTFIQGDDLAPEVVASLDVADIVFIDTSHVYEHTLREFHIYRYLVRPGGVIACHDTQLEHPLDAPRHPRFPGPTAIEEFVSAEGLTWTDDPACNGLGVIQL